MTLQAVLTGDRQVRGQSRQLDDPTSAAAALSGDLLHRLGSCRTPASKRPCQLWAGPNTAATLSKSSPAWTALGGVGDSSAVLCPTVKVIPRIRSFAREIRGLRSEAGSDPTSGRRPGHPRCSPTSGQGGSGSPWRRRRAPKLLCTTGTSLEPCGKAGQISAVRGITASQKTQSRADVC